MEISGRAKVLGVIGHPVGHSLSPAMHNAAIEALGLDYIYVPFDVAPGSLRQATDGIRALGLAGVNVTIPHKETVIPFLDEVEDGAREVGSVNTVANVGGRLVGSSTDGQGFMRSLEEAGFAAAGSKAVVLGAGGAGRAVTFALLAAGAEVAVFDEAPGKAQNLAEDARGRIQDSGVRIQDSGFRIQGPAVLSPQSSALSTELAEANLLVNCTPVGMRPRQDEIPVAPELLRPGLLVYDLVYNPVRTRLLDAAEVAGARTVSGVKMLVYQGAISFRTWTGVDPPADVMEAAVLERLER